MSETLFEVDLSELRVYACFCKQVPKVIARAAGSLLNEFAFGTRVESFYEIASRMTLRNPAFVSSRLRVTKSGYSLPISSQISIMGSVAIAPGAKSKGGFSGWKEQEYGTATKRRRTINLLARAGSKSAIVLSKARLKPSKHFISYEDIRLRGKTSAQLQNIVMMQMLSRAHSRQPFIIRNKMGMTPGLWMFVDDKPRLLQMFEGKQPHKIPWIIAARMRYFREHNTQASWSKALGYAFKAYGKRSWR
jgi:hypothetical protein